MYRTTRKIIVCCAMMLGSFSCKHEIEPFSDGNNRLIPARMGEKAVSEYVMIVNLGHDAKGCNGCILNHGRYIHIDCQGYGTACRAAAAVSLNKLGTSIIATTTDTFGLTSEDFFNMPDRSLEYIDTNNNYMFLNIPAQIVYRDSTTLQFTFTGLSFTSTPLYSNN